ncbi:ATP-binding cassette domain-containing protein [Paraferrimonas sp. SM1919]|uniref:ATP-binding cassette domain-containing protein n=1 Tax=Paraferrimonas sp. SM1919 TaxID=2662263 RepID=UPI0013D594F1|nr:ATP-binding cassette domain-containing protein [Paraferrimonas sp. SM1919]
MAQALVEVENLSFSRGPRQIFDGLNLKVLKGKVTAIMGPSGIGKTTLLKLMAGELIPDAGSVTLLGQKLSQLDRAQLFKLRKDMSMLFQSGALFTDLSVFDNVALALREHTQLSESLIKKLVLMKLQAVGLRGAKDLMPSELSGGMQRRVALARAIALDPQLLFFDEPFAGQDPISMGVLTQLIRQLSDALDLTSVVVSHDVVEVLSIADYVYVVADKKIIGEGTPAQLKATNDPRIQQFLAGSGDGPVAFHMPAADYLQELQ